MAHQYIFAMKDLRRVHPPDREVLKGIWLSFFPGAKIGVLGANGAGKSTLVKVLTGVMRADSGAIRVRDTEVRVGSPPCGVGAG